MQQRFCSPPAVDAGRMTSTPAESGAVMVLVALSLVAVLLSLGLALDAGNLYRAQLALQGAVDAAALSSVNLVNENIRDFPTDDNAKMETKLSPYAARSVRVNLSRSGYESRPGHPVTVSVGYSASPATESNLFRFTVTATRKVDYFLMSAIPGFGQKFSEVSASASTERKIANVALLLDASGSMACPAGAPCTCLTPQRTGPCPTTGRKFDQLVEAVGEFIKLFNVDRDRIVFIPFNRSASALTLQELAETLDQNGTPLRHPVTNAQIDALKQLMRQKIVPGLETNVCDALLRGRESLRKLASDETLSMVLFSDGAPTAGRFLLSDIKSGRIGPWVTERSGNRASGNYDYSSHAVEWVLPPNPAAPNVFPTFPGPSKLYQTGMFTPLAPQGNPNAQFASCYNGNSDSPPVSSEADIKTATTRAFSPCVNSLEFHVPFAPQQKYGGNYKVNGNASQGDPDNDQYFVEQYYNCAVATSDFIRDDRGTIYAIGYGPTSAVADPLDPYADVRDGFNRKDIFNARLAADQDSLLALRPDLSAAEIPQFPFTGYRTFEAEIARNPEGKGTYLATGNIEEVRTLFQRMGRLILLRLVA